MIPAPGARVAIRDAEWVVRRVDMTSDGAYQLVCDGISELVREHEAVYLSSLEEIEVLDPALTRLKLEQSSQPAAHKTNREKRARDDIDDVFSDYWQWIEDTMTTEETPWLKVICAMVGEG